MNFLEFWFLGVFLRRVELINCSYNGKGTTVILHKYVSFSPLVSGTNRDWKEASKKIRHL